MGLKILSSKRKDVYKDKKLTKYLFKNVYTKDGEKIGRVRQIIFDHQEIHGIIVGKFLFFKKTFIDMEYVDKFTLGGVLLKINPIFLLLGKLVFDSEGKIVGKVKRINRKTNANSIDSIIVKKGIFRKEIEIEPKDMVLLKKNIRLKISL